MKFSQRLKKLFTIYEPMRGHTGLYNRQSITELTSLSISQQQSQEIVDDRPLGQQRKPQAAADRGKVDKSSHLR